MKIPTLTLFLFTLLLGDTSSHVVNISLIEEISDILEKVAEFKTQSVSIEEGERKLIKKVIPYQFVALKQQSQNVTMTRYNPSGQLILKFGFSNLGNLEQHKVTSNAIVFISQTENSNRYYY